MKTIFQLVPHKASSSIIDYDSIVIDISLLTYELINTYLHIYVNITMH